MHFRKMTSADSPDAFVIAFAGREKSFTREGLDAAGITEEFVVKILDVDKTHEGWICECDGKKVGNAIANKATGELWFIAVLPEYEKRGIGSHLHDTALEWLKSHGWKEAWLGTLKHIQLTGYGFFTKRGWIDSEVRGDFTIMKKPLE